MRGIVGDPQTTWPWQCPGTVGPEQSAAAPTNFPPLVGYRSLEPSEIEGYFGPDHGPATQPTLEPKSYVEPLKPILGLDGKIHYIPANSAPQD